MMSNDALLVRPRRRLDRLSAIATPAAFTLGDNGSFSVTAFPGNAVGYGLGVGFQPDLIWTRNLGLAVVRIVDSVRGTGRSFNFATTVEATDNFITSFHSNGYTCTSNADYCLAGASHLTLAWRRSVAAGLDIINYIGSGSARTIAHNLGTVPRLMLIKRRSGGSAGWITYSTEFTTPTQNYLQINNSLSLYTDSTGAIWNNTLPDASGFSLGTGVDVNASGSNYTAYVFSDRPGLFDTIAYTGNGSASGPVVLAPNLNAVPKFVIIKRLDANGDWYFFDQIRGGRLFSIPYGAGTSSASISIAFQQNGFQLTGNNIGINANNGRYLSLMWS